MNGCPSAAPGMMSWTAGLAKTTIVTRVQQYGASLINVRKRLQVMSRITKNSINRCECLPGILSGENAEIKECDRRNCEPPRDRQRGSSLLTTAYSTLILTPLGPKDRRQ